MDKNLKPEDLIGILDFRSKQTPRPRVIGLPESWSMQVLAQDPLTEKNGWKNWASAPPCLAGVLTDTVFDLKNP